MFIKDNAIAKQGETILEYFPFLLQYVSSPSPVIIIQMGILQFPW